MRGGGGVLCEGEEKSMSWKSYSACLSICLNLLEHQVVRW